ncbi:MAG: hypothetical protein D6696_13415 [Acidobacteria bacterium]|nr:MAG: hypothetical protein D6696_13415 [Acidobacteriota bacterium]
MLRLLQWLVRREGLLRLLSPAFGRFQPFSAAHRRDPHATWRALREEAPAWRSRIFGTTLFTRYEDVLRILSDSHFSTDRSGVPAMRWIARLTRGEPEFAGLIERNLLTIDGADHRRLRGLVAKAFTPRRVERLRPRLVAPAAAPQPAAADDPPAGGPPASRPDVLVYLIDTLRADHLGCYGYPRPTSPQIDALAAEAALFEHAIAQSSWTKASVASIFTGRWPLAHGANLRTDALAAAAQTLAETLHHHGYATAGFVTNPNVTSAFGFDQGFERYHYLGETASAAEVNAAALAWLDARPPDARPFFLYLHTLEPHAPYRPPAAFRERLAPQVPAALAAEPDAVLDAMQAGRRPVEGVLVDHLRALYDAEIAANDDAFGALRRAFETRGRWRDLLLVLASDHGEEFYEHGNFQHGRTLHRESLEVPLIVKLPGPPVRRRIGERVQHVDLLPTILDAAGLPPTAGSEGRSLLPLLRGAAPGPSRPTFAYLHLDGPARAAIYDRGFKLLQQLAGGGELIHRQLYDLAGDRQERRDLAGDRPLLAGFLAARLRSRLFGPEQRLAGDAAVIDEELRRSLEALGYLE